MQPVECEFEAEVLSAVLQSRWPERADPALQAHVADCTICSDVAAVAGVIEDAREEMRAEVVVPDSGRVWWLARVRARQEAAKTAARPITATQMIAGACAVGLLGACFGATSAWFQDALRWMGSAFAGFDLAGELMAHGTIVLGMAGVLLLVPFAAWLAMRRE
jgi:hypothetical protein